MSWVQFPPPALVIVLLVTLLGPGIYSVDAESNSQSQNISTSVVFNASGIDELSTSSTPVQGSESGTVGPFAGVLSASFMSLPLYGDLNATNDEWTAKMYLSGSGNVWMRVILESNVGIIGQSDSGPISLSGTPQPYSLTGDGFAAQTLLKDSRLTLTFEVRGNTPANANMHWGTSDMDSSLLVSANFVEVLDVKVEDAGKAYDDGEGDYGRKDIEISANIRTKVSLDSMMDEMILWVQDGEEGLVISNQTVEGGEGNYLVKWQIENLNNGSNISVEIAWIDSEGQTRRDLTVWSWIYPSTEEGSLISADTLVMLQWATAPILLLVGYWMIKRQRRFCSRDDALDELEYRAFNKLVISASCFIIAALNIMFFIVNHHVRNLGAKESQIILHLGLLALLYGASGPIWGRLADRRGNRRGLVKAAGFLGVASSLLMAPLSLWPFFIASMLLMVTLGIQRLHFAIASEWFPEQKGEAIGILYAFGYLATAIVAVINGSIYTWFGIWATCITSAALIAIGSMVFMRIDVNRIDMTSSDQTTMKPDENNLLKFESKWVKWCLLGAFLVAIPRGAVVLTSPRYIEIRGFDIAMTSLFESWAIISLVILYAFTGWVCDRFGAEKVLLTSALAYGILWSLFSIGLSPWLAVAIYLIPIVPLLLVSNDALLSRFSTLKERNRGLGMSGAAAFVGQSIGIAFIVLLMSWFESGSYSDTEVYHMAYRSNIPLFALAVIVTWILAARIGRENKTTLDV